MDWKLNVLYYKSLNALEIEDENILFYCYFIVAFQRKNKIFSTQFQIHTNCYAGVMVQSISNPYNSVRFGHLCFQ